MALPANPNPAGITTEMWHFWLAFKQLEPSAVLSGIYGDWKPGYHASRRDLLARPEWRNDYSIQLPDDKLGPDDKGAAIDITFPDAQKGQYATISKYMSRLVASGKDLNDERGNYLREAYGQADGDLAVEGWDFQYLVSVTSDSSHLWHIHLSFIRRWVTSAKCMRAVLSILRGEAVEVWRAREAQISNGSIPEPPIVEDGMARTLTNDDIVAIWNGPDIIKNYGPDASNPTWVPGYSLGWLVGEVRKLSGLTASAVADEVVKRLPAGAVDVDALADAIAARMAASHEASAAALRGGVDV